MTTELIEAVIGRVDTMRPGLLGAIRSTQAHRVMVMLTEPPEGSTPEERERWERTCDLCGAYDGPDGKFLTGSKDVPLQGAIVTVTFGVCPDCADKVV